MQLRQQKLGIPEGGIKLGSMSNPLIKGITIDEITHMLVRLYAYAMVVTHFSLAVLNRLEDQAAIVLEAVFEEKVKQNFEHARTIADRRLSHQYGFAAHCDG